MHQAISKPMCHPSLTSLDIAVRGNHIDASLTQTDESHLHDIILSVGRMTGRMSGIALMFYNFEVELGGRSWGHRPDGFVFEASRSDSTTSDFMSESSIHTQLQFDSSYCQHCDFANTLGILLRSLDLSDLNHLKMHGLLTSEMAKAPALRNIECVIADLIVASKIEVLELHRYTLLMLPGVLDFIDKKVLTYPTGTYQPLLFSSLHTLVLVKFMDLSSYGHHMHDTPSEYDFGDLFDSLDRQATRYRGTCGSFSRLIISQYKMKTEHLYDLVDAVSNIVGQQGRFTVDPPSVPCYPGMCQPLAALSLPTIELSKHIQHEEPKIGLQPTTYPIYERWDAHCRSASITFDFRGSSGCQSGYGH